MKLQKKYSQEKIFLINIYESLAAKPLCMLLRMREPNLISRQGSVHGQDQFGYRFYDLVDKKLMRSRDAMFMEDPIIEDIEKVQKTTPNDNFIELELTPSTKTPRQVEDETHEDQHELHDGDDAFMLKVSQIPVMFRFNHQ